MNTIDIIREKLKEHFPEHVFWVSTIYDKNLHRMIRAEITGDGHLALRFADMPKFADAFGTENLNFGKTEDDPAHRYSSWTYDDGTPGKLFVEGWE